MSKSLEYSMRIDGMQQSIEDTLTLGEVMDNLGDKLNKAGQKLAEGMDKGIAGIQKTAGELEKVKKVFSSQNDITDLQVFIEAKNKLDNLDTENLRKQLQKRLTAEQRYWQMVQILMNGRKEDFSTLLEFTQEQWQSEVELSEKRLSLMQKGSAEYLKEAEKQAMILATLEARKIKDAALSEEQKNALSLQMQEDFFEKHQRIFGEIAEMNKKSPKAEEKAKAELEAEAKQTDALKAELTKRYREGEIKKKKYEAEIQKIEKESLEKQLTINQQYGQKTADLEAKLTELSLKMSETGKNRLYNTVKEYMDKIQALFTNAMASINVIFDSFKATYQAEIDANVEVTRRIEREKEEIDKKLAESNDNIEAANNKLKASYGGRAAIVQEELDREAKALEALQEKKKSLEDEEKKLTEESAKLTKRKARTEAQQKVVQAIVNVALGVTKAWSYGPILGPIMAALVATMGGIQVATMTKQLSRMADGGLLQGRRHAQGGMRIEGSNIEVEGGEYVVNRLSTQRNLGLMHYINSQRRELNAHDIEGYFSSADAQAGSPPLRTLFAAGGQLPAQDMLDASGDDSIVHLIRAIESIDMQPVVSVTDIVDAQHSVTQVTGWGNIR